MARTWHEAFDLGDRAPGAAPDLEPAAEEPAAERGGLLSRLRDSLSKSRQALGAELAASLGDQLDEATWERLEETLIFADVGAKTTADVVERLEREVDAGDVEGPEAARARLIELLAEVAETGEPRIDVSKRPAVLMVVGVNGSGKTTTIGKIAWHLEKELGLSVILAAGDTYRAAAVEQLETWAERSGAQIVTAKPGTDSGAVAFDAISAAEARGIDVVIADTAGRLHTHGNLMDELAKVRRVIAKKLDGAPHETLITIDSTTGPERPAPGAGVLRGGRAQRRRADEARRHREGGHRARDRRGARDPGEADRGGGGARGPAPVRLARVRRGAALRLRAQSAGAARRSDSAARCESTVVIVAASVRRL